MIIITATTLVITMNSSNAIHNDDSNNDTNNGKAVESYFEEGEEWFGAKVTEDALSILYVLQCSIYDTTL